MFEELIAFYENSRLMDRNGNEVQRKLEPDEEGEEGDVT